MNAEYINIISKFSKSYTNIIRDEFKSGDIDYMIDRKLIFFKFYNKLFNYVIQKLKILK